MQIRMQVRVDVFLEWVSKRHTEELLEEVKKILPDEEWISRPLALVEQARKNLFNKGDPPSLKSR